MLAEYCTCGSGIRLVGLDEEEDAAVMTLWQGLHSGSGHESCSAFEASVVRWPALPSRAALG